MAFKNCPWGIEDGHIVAYSATSTSLSVEYQFWNEEVASFVFDQFVGLRDCAAIGVTVGAVSERKASEFVEALKQQRFANAPPGLSWISFQFLDLDEQPILEVVAETCRFAGVED